MKEQDYAGFFVPAADASTPERDEHAHQLGPFLCWAVVFADIGTSVYYTPGILFSGVGVHAALFVAMTLVVFLLLTTKYAEVATRYPEGGGVVTVGSRAIHPYVGLLGGMFILVDYFLTAALSALSGVIYLSVVAPRLAPLVLPVTLAALVILSLLNWIGISESAKASAIFASIAFLSQIAVVIAVIVHVGIGGALATIPKVFSGPHLTPLTVLTGYSGAFLAFSGLESIAQLSPVMRRPRQRVSRQAMWLVVGAICLTSPLLTLFSTTLLNASKDDPNQFISLLGGFSVGQLLSIEVAITGAALLVFASNTAIIGSYHVFLALTRMRFFPQFLEHRNSIRGTPHWAILVAVGIPILVLVLAQGSITLLGDLYAFGLLGAFSLTCLSLDIVRWREGWFRLSTIVKGRHENRAGRGRSISFALGALTTFLVILAWTTNLFAKPLATEFGGGVATVGLLIALVNYTVLTRRGRTVPFPVEVRGVLPECVLVLLPAHGDYDHFVKAAATAAKGRPVAFLFRETQKTTRHQPRIFEMVDPYLNDRTAQNAFANIEREARELQLDRRYIYIPEESGPEAVMDVWRTLRPEDTMVAAGEEEILHGVAPDRIRRPVGTGTPILHYLKHWDVASEPTW